jgi:hypothetical protein
MKLSVWYLCLMDTSPGPQLLTADQIDALPVGSIIETVDGSWSTVYLRRGGHWSDTNGSFVYSGNGFVVGKTYLVRSGPLK